LTLWDLGLVLTAVTATTSWSTAAAASRRLRTMATRPNGASADDTSLGLDSAVLLELCAAACLGGVSPARAVELLVDALPVADGEVLRATAAAVSLGASPEQAWAPLRDDPRLRPLAVAMSRSGTTGAQLAEQLRSSARDLRAERASATTEAARRAGVRAVLPLGGCFLPAFVLLGVVPTLVGLASLAFVGGLS
jgi:Flp pilus assembly protein TadB